MEKNPDIGTETRDFRSVGQWIASCCMVGTPKPTVRMNARLGECSTNDFHGNEIEFNNLNEQVKIESKTITLVSTFPKMARSIWSTAAITKTRSSGRGVIEADRNGQGG